MPPAPTTPGDDLTASELAGVLGMTRQATAKALGDIPATAQRTMRGVAAQSWSVKAMPAALRDRVQAMVKQRGVRTPRDLLTQRVTPWQPSRTWAELHNDFTSEAIRRRDALADILTHHRHEPLPQLLERVRPAWRAVFGSVAAARLDADRLRYLCNRTIERDRSFGQFHRPELYLDDAAFHTHCATAESIVDQSLHAPLLVRVKEIADKGKPTADERAVFLDHVFRHFKGLCAQTADEARRREIKQSVLDWLLAVFPCPILARTAKAFRRAFDRDRALWLAKGEHADALRKNRGEGGGRPPHVCEPCWKKVHDAARKLRGQGGMGNVTLAYRRLRTSGELCAECCRRFKFNPRKDKSYVPVNFRVNATPNALTLAKDRGYKHALAIAPKRQCTWDDTDPGDFYVIDDWTPGHLCWDRVDGEIVFGMIQIIEVEDLKSANPLGLVSYFGAPTQMHIRRLYHRVFIQGARLPRNGVLHEHGVFKSRLTRGDHHQERSFNPWSNVETALRRHYGMELSEINPGQGALLREEREMGLSQAGLGLEVRHANHPWSKPIEGSFHIRQKQLSSARGFVGFQQRNEMPDHLADFMRRVKAGKEDPNQEFPSHAELLAEYDKVCHEFRHEPQPRSKRLRGASPFEAWTESITRRPLRELPDEMAYAIATHKLPMKLGAGGLSLSLGGVRRVWANEELGEWYGSRNIRDVIGYWHLENPQLLTITDMKGKNRLTLRALTSSRMNATRDQNADIAKSQRGYIAAATTKHSGITQEVISTLTQDNDYTEGQKAIGRHINEAVEIEAKIVAQEAPAPRGGNRLAEAYGLASSENVMDAPARRAPSTREQELRARIAAKSQSTPNQPKA